LGALTELQQQLARRVIERPLQRDPHVVGGADVHFVNDRALAAAVSIDWQRWHLRESSQIVRRAEFPYVPGYLSFREAPALIAVVNSLTTAPDLLFVDGQGRAHPRRCGLACHVGVILGIPTVGVAKSRLVGHYEEPGPERGALSPLLDQGEVIGMVVRTKAGARPVFVSVGHLITLEEAVKWTLLVTRDRIPEPTLHAHRLARRAAAAEHSGSGRE
jgi:deoxyribonuclease V